eukprot:TRINITY_DN9508_c0_g1_i1.p1 TRINITY_DN9508_c0_g1~~TRINITY_DN9508_c0_g1_i1.p1  ORF type:complete len:152 (+),score=24.90 TRINITY_DN9508_c0_g1_i1:68-523(+)
MESNEHLSPKSVRRTKQIALVKSSEAYALYAANVPKEKRGEEGFPCTPPVSPRSNATISKRKWERMQLEWRGCIEQYYAKMLSGEPSTETSTEDKATSELINTYFKNEFSMPSLESPTGESRLSLYKNWESREQTTPESSKATSSCSPPSS